MAKNLWIAGQSGNNSGRPVGSRYSVKTVKGRIERFLARNMSAKAMQTMYDKLSEREKAQFLVQLMPFIIPRQSMESLTTDQVDELYNRITQAMNKNKSNVKVG